LSVPTFGFCFGSTFTGAVVALKVLVSATVDDVCVVGVGKLVATVPEVPGSTALRALVALGAEVDAVCAIVALADGVVVAFEFPGLLSPGPPVLGSPGVLVSPERVGSSEDPPG